MGSEHKVRTGGEKVAQDAIRLEHHGQYAHTIVQQIAQVCYNIFFYLFLSLNFFFFFIYKIIRYRRLELCGDYNTSGAGESGGPYVTLK